MKIVYLHLIFFPVGILNRMVMYKGACMLGVVGLLVAVAECLSYKGPPCWVSKDVCIKETAEFCRIR